MPSTRFLYLYMTKNTALMFKKMSYLLPKFFINWFQVFAVAAPRSIELDQNIFIGVINNFLKRLSNNNLEGKKRKVR